MFEVKDVNTQYKLYIKKSFKVKDFFRIEGDPGIKTETHLQHCFLMLRPPNLGLSRQLVQTPQSSGT